MMETFEQQVADTEAWMQQPRFEGITRLYHARQVVQQRGTITNDYPVARVAADEFHERLRDLFDHGLSITTFGPYSPGQAVAMKRMGIEGIYLGGWATSAKGSTREDPGPDLASYPLSQVPDEAAVLVRALLTADRNQSFTRSQMSERQRSSTAEYDYRPFIIADADTGHGGDAHVRNLIRRFVEAGVPGYHIEDQRPGTKKCGHQGGKVLVAQDEQIKRLNAARFQLDTMNVGGILVARTDAEAATLLDNNSDERDQPFILGTTSATVPGYKLAYLTLLRRFHDAGVPVNGHQLYALSWEDYVMADEWLDRVGITEVLEDTVAAQAHDLSRLDSMVQSVAGRFAEAWESEAGLKTFGQAVADEMEFRGNEGETFSMSVQEWLTFARTASFITAQAKAAELGIHVTWDCERARTPEGYYQVQGGIEYAIAKSLAAAPFADLLWMETRTADLQDAQRFADAIHAVYPDKMLAYNLSPSFSWDTTGMTEDEMRAFPEQLGQMGFVFNFITYGGHQIDGLASEEFAQALQQDGMLALARLQRKFRLVESPFRTPQTLVGGPRLDSALTASSGRTATTRAMGKGSTQFQHLVQTEVPPSLLQDWLELWREHYQYSDPLRVELRPHTAGSDLLELRILNQDKSKLANVIFATIQDRRGQRILSVRDQNTFHSSLRQRRLMTLLHLFLIHRYRVDAVHYLSPTNDNQTQTEKMKGLGIYSEVANEVGEIIVADVDAAGVAHLLDTDNLSLLGLIQKRPRNADSESASGTVATTSPA